MELEDILNEWKNSMVKIPVGIDLGTTASSVAYITAEGTPELITNEFGQQKTPSLVYYGGVLPLVGGHASAARDEGNWQIAAAFKRSLGSPAVLHAYQNRHYTAVEYTTLLLRYLKEQTEQQLTTTLSDVVVAVPAHFTHRERSATLEAAHNAGLNILRLISEPTAAALAYGMRASLEEQLLLVYDLGGGTFDVSLIELTPTIVRVLATGGDHQLGGINWDDCLVTYLEQLFAAEFFLPLTDEDRHWLRISAEKLKHTLSTRHSGRISVHARGHTGNYEVTREKFARLTHHLLERTEQITRQTLQEAKVAWEDLTGVLLVGQATQMDMIRASLRQMSAQPFLHGIHPGTAVALGAAIQAAQEMEARSPSLPLARLVGRRVIQERMAHSLGMIIVSEEKRRYKNTILLTKNLPFPSSHPRPYQMMRGVDGEQTMELLLTQGEEEDPRTCTYLGSYLLDNHSGSGKSMTVLQITYEYDKNGIVHLRAVEQASGKPLKLSVSPVSGDIATRFQLPPPWQSGREHLTVYLALDLSGSIFGMPLMDIQKAVEIFIEHCDITRTSLGLIAFSDRASIEQNATQHLPTLLKALQHLKVGSTGYGSAGHPFESILNAPGSSAGQRCAIILTDGVWASQEAAVQQAQRCRQAGIEIIAIGFGQADLTFLTQIASSPKQSCVIERRQLTETLCKVAQELLESGHKRKPHWEK